MYFNPVISEKLGKVLLLTLDKNNPCALAENLAPSVEHTPAIVKD